MRFSGRRAGEVQLYRQSDALLTNLGRATVLPPSPSTHVRMTETVERARQTGGHVMQIEGDTGLLSWFV